MHWGSKYCAGCRYNRDCYMLNSNSYSGYGNSNEMCIILKNMFENEYKKVNNKENKNE